MVPDDPNKEKKGLDFGRVANLVLMSLWFILMANAVNKNNIIWVTVYVTFIFREGIHFFVMSSQTENAKGRERFLAKVDILVAALVSLLLIYEMYLTINNMV